MNVDVDSEHCTQSQAESEDGIPNNKYNNRQVYVIVLNI